jgi:hypothetical protein
MRPGVSGKNCQFILIFQISIFTAKEWLSIITKTPENIFNIHIST